VCEIGDGLRRPESKILPDVALNFLSLLELDLPKMERTICILERSGRHGSPAAGRMVEHLQQFARHWRQAGRSEATFPLSGQGAWLGPRSGRAQGSRTGAQTLPGP